MCFPPVLAKENYEISKIYENIREFEINLLANVLHKNEFRVVELIKNFPEKKINSLKVVINNLLFCSAFEKLGVKIFFLSSIEKAGLIASRHLKFNFFAIFKVFQQKENEEVIAWMESNFLKSLSEDEIDSYEESGRLISSIGESEEFFISKLKDLIIENKKIVFQTVIYNKFDLASGIHGTDFINLCDLAYQYKREWFFRKLTPFKNTLDVWALPRLELYSEELKKAPNEHDLLKTINRLLNPIKEK